MYSAKFEWAQGLFVALEAYFRATIRVSMQPASVAEFIMYRILPSNVPLMMMRKMKGPHTAVGFTASVRRLDELLTSVRGIYTTEWKMRPTSPCSWPS